jgi:hypothetical protein
MARRKPTNTKTLRGVRNGPVPRVTARPLTEGTGSPHTTERFVAKVTVPVTFWNARLEADQWQPPRLENATPALKRLGPMPFARPGFPLMGLLATVYEQVAAHVLAVLHSAPMLVHEPDQN